MKTKIVFFGSSKYVIPIIKVLQKNFDLSLVVTTEAPKHNLALQGDALQSYPVVKYCVENKIPCLSVSSLFDPKVNDQLSNARPPASSLAGEVGRVNCQIAVLADFGLFIPNEILNIFPKGIINIHPSLLPKYRGPTPVQTAILDGKKETGVSIIKLDQEIDHGPILGQEKEEILPLDTAQSLYERLFRKGGEMLPNILNKYLNGSLSIITQNHKHATFTKHLTRQNGFVDINKPPPPEVLKRMINAYFPWPGVWTKIIIDNKELRTKFLPDKKIQVEGKKPMSYKDFKNGYPNLGKEILIKLGLIDKVK